MIQDPQTTLSYWTAPKLPGSGTNKSLLYKSSGTQGAAQSQESRFHSTVWKYLLKGGGKDFFFFKSRNNLSPGPLNGFLSTCFSSSEYLTIPLQCSATILGCFFFFFSWFWSFSRAPAVFLNIELRILSGVASTSFYPTSHGDYTLSKESACFQCPEQMETKLFSTFVPRNKAMLCRQVFAFLYWAIGIIIIIPTALLCRSFTIYKVPAPPFFTILVFLGRMDHVLCSTMSQRAWVREKDLVSEATSKIPEVLRFANESENATALSVTCSFPSNYLITSLCSWHLFWFLSLSSPNFHLKNVWAENWELAL